MKMIAFPGDWPLTQLQENIRLEEAGGLELFDCVVATDKQNHPINICKFNILEPGERPKHIFLVKAGSSKPANTEGNKLLTDVVVAGSQFTTVDFYREK